MIAAGVPVVPGTEGRVEADEAVRLAPSIGFPLLIKASAGGGGKGIRLVKTPEEIEGAVRVASSEAQSAFGDGGVFLERYLSPVRHVEIQILADKHGNAVALGERECSVQRRHQKLLEESPSPVLSEATRREDDGRRRRGGEGIRLLQRRHGRVPVRPGDGRVLLPRSEHAPAGGAPGDGVALRTRPRARPDPHRRRRAAGLHAGRRRRCAARRSSAASPPRIRTTTTCRRSGASTT